MTHLAIQLGSLLALAGTTVARDTTKTDRKPNVLFLMADDFRADAIGAVGHPVVQTPNLDSLVKTGFRFTNAYCLGSNSPAVCLPSRNMFLTGRAYFRWQGQYASGDEPSFPLSMNQAGYESYHHGKRGNTAIKVQEKFHHNKYVDDQKERTSGEPGQRIVDEAIAFLKGRREERPFFLYLAFESPHDPRVAAERYMNQYDRDQIPLPSNYLPLHPFDNGEQLVRDERLAAWPRTEAETRKHLHDYYAVITALDGHIGRLLQALKDLGQYDNTIIVFSADHGLAMGSHGLMGKQSLYEHSMKPPLIFAGCGIPTGTSDALVYLLDIYPTVSDLVGAPIPKELDGKSLVPILRGQKKAVRPTLFLAYRDVQRAIRDDRWKLIRYPHLNKTQLFDLTADPEERNDLAGNPAAQERIQAMLTELRRWQAELGDGIPLSSDNPGRTAFVPPTAAELEVLDRKTNPAKRAKVSRKNPRG